MRFRVRNDDPFPALAFRYRRIMKCNTCKNEAAPHAASCERCLERARDRLRVPMRNKHRLKVGIPLDAPPFTRAKAVLGIRAFAIECKAWEPPAVSILKTKDKERAKLRALLSMRDAGYGNGRFRDFKVRRSAKFDKLNLETDRCYGIDYAEQLLSQQ